MARAAKTASGPEYLVLDIETVPDALARLVGLPSKVGVDGSQVEGLFRAGQLARGIDRAQLLACADPAKRSA